MSSGQAGSFFQNWNRKTWQENWTTTTDVFNCSNYLQTNDDDNQGHLLDNLSKLSGFLQGAHHTMLDPLPDVLHTIKEITMVKLVVLTVRMVTKLMSGRISVAVVMSKSSLPWAPLLAACCEELYHVQYHEPEKCLFSTKYTCLLPFFQPFYLSLVSLQLLL